jgi:GT2 family glycosyltransferase
MQLSVIIVNFNTYDLTVDCINSIHATTRNVLYEIIVVDNAPKTDYKTGLLQHFPNIKYILSPENVGFGRANNLGMDVAEGAYFLLLNSDTIVKDGCFEKCIAFMDAHNDAGVIGCRLLNEDGSFQHSFYPYINNSVWNYFISNNPILYKVFGVAKKFREPKEAQRVGDVSGAFMFMKREVVEKVKGFDPDFFLYCEETEWCRERIAKHFNIYFYPGAETMHLCGKSAPREPMFIQSKLSLSMLWYKRGTGSYLLYILLTYLNVLYFLLTYPFAGADNKLFVKRYAGCYWKIFPYLIFDVPKYGRGYGVRKEPLIYDEARPIFFPNQR